MNIPNEAVEAAYDKYLHLGLNATEIEGILEAAAPHMLGAELAAEYRRGYRDGLVDRKQVTAEPCAWEPGDPVE